MSDKPKDTNQTTRNAGEPGWAGKIVVLMSPKDRKPVAIATVSLEDGLVSCDDANILEDWNSTGILGRSEKGIIYPRDGQAFLDELPFAYRSPYLWAEPCE